MFLIKLAFIIAMLLVLSPIFVSAAEAELGKDNAGRPMVMIDHAPAALIPGMTFNENTDNLKFSAFNKTGLKQVVVFANLGFFSSKLGYVGPAKAMREFWRGKNDYDKSDVDKLLSEPLKANPDFKIIVWLGFGEYPEFGFNNPDDIIRNDKGEALIATTHFIRFDNAPPNAAKQEHYAVSFFSERYRQECADMLAEFVRTVESSQYGKNVIGYFIGGGQDAQLYSWSPPDGYLGDKPANWGDYSPVAKKAFTKCVEKKYGDVAKLNQAWNVNLTSFEQITPPSAAELTGAAPFHDPVKERRVYDWKRFLAGGRAEILEYFASAIKRASGRKIIVGASGGDGGHRRDNTSISQLMRSENLDFLVHQAAYAVRIPPSCGGINALLDSYAVNGKIFLTDMDHRLWTGKKNSGGTIGVVSYTDISVGRAADMSMQRNMWRREYARLWVSGNNCAWFSNFGPGTEYENAEIQDEMRFLNNFSNNLVASRCKGNQDKGDIAAPAEVVFINDEAQIDYARGAIAEFHMAGMTAQWNEANVSGVPIRYYYAQDLRDGKIPPAKLYVFQNIIDVDIKLAERIKELRKAGASIVLLQGTGLAQLLGGQQKYLDDVLGINLRLLDTMAKNAGGVNSKLDTTHPLLKGSEWNYKVQSLNYEKIKEVKGIALTVDGDDATVLANYPVSGMPAVAATTKGGSKVIFVGAHTLSRDIISRLAAYAGAWRVSPPGNAIAADKKILMIHPLKSGKVDVTLKEPAALTEIQPGNMVSPKAARHSFELNAGQTYLFMQQQ